VRYSLPWRPRRSAALQLKSTIGLGATVTILSSFVVAMALQFGFTYARLFENGKWIDGGRLRYGRVEAAFVRLWDGRVLAIGGSHPSAQAKKTTELWEPYSATWRLGPISTMTRLRHTATLLNDGRVLVVGGLDGDEPAQPLFQATSSTEIYDPVKDVFSVGPLLLGGARSRHVAVLLRDGRVLVAGGESAQGVLSSAEVFNPDSDSWKMVAPMSMPRSGASAVLLPDGRVLIVGGAANITDDWVEQRGQRSAELFDPQTERWATLAPMIEQRWWGTATLLQDGRVLVAGLVAHQAGQPQRIGGAETWNPTTNEWTATPAMLSPVDWGMMASRLPSGDVLVVGGDALRQGSTESYAVAQVYVTKENRWAIVEQPVRQARLGGTLVTLQDGLVMLAGGAADSHCRDRNVCADAKWHAVTGAATDA